MRRVLTPRGSRTPAQAWPRIATSPSLQAQFPSGAWCLAAAAAGNAAAAAATPAPSVSLPSSAADLRCKSCAFLQSAAAWRPICVSTAVQLLQGSQHQHLQSHVRHCYRPRTTPPLLSQLPRHQQPHWQQQRQRRDSICGSRSGSGGGAMTTAPCAEQDGAVVTTPGSGLCPDVEALVRRIHASGSRGVICLTGGGVQALSWLLGVPGASKCILDAHIPYSRDSMVELLGQDPEQYCCEETARLMARAAYRKAANLTAFGEPIIGLGATSSLATDVPKRGEHRSFIATFDGLTSTLHAITLAKGTRVRWQEDELVSRVLLKALSAACHVETNGLPNVAPVNGSEDHVQVSHEKIDDPIQSLIDGDADCVEFSGGNIFVDAPRRSRVYLPGSFNPLHEGHTGLLRAACMAIRQELEGCFELSIGNPDKGLLPADEVKTRVQQFIDAKLPVIVTKCALFVQKAELLQQSTFTVGFDTAVRLIMTKYYDNSRTRMLLLFDKLRYLGCKFLVAGRKDGPNDAYHIMDELTLPPEMEDLFQKIPEQEFRMDLSSTELRKNRSLGIG